MTIILHAITHNAKPKKNLAKENIKRRNKAETKQNFNGTTKNGHSRKTYLEIHVFMVAFYKLGKLTAGT